ncbi:ABC transporter ATP-binding protein [Duganella sp. HH105]|uniref:ABC transporter ATP-binding protein n=1 Tax=Duganella sp. HH105 TaxID=1781067 RepID=UPI000877DEAB|nr:ABC transporter transmembrane domain-containing protein [Duganella sp. HH105]OEZ59047.1 multidrug resistance ABC transporter ATP-binding/permease protein BmrA [Duganella sp. HH105]
MTNPHLQRLALLRAFAPRLALGLMFMALTVLVELSYPRALAYFIDHIGLKSDGSWFGPFAATVTAVLALQAVATTMRYYLFESTGHLIVARIRRLLYGALIQQPVGFYDKHNVGELTSRLSGDVEILHDTLTMGLAISLRSLCVLAGCVVMLLLISPVLSLILLVYVPLTLFMGDWLGKHVRRQSREIRQRQADCGSVAHEYFSNIRLVHAFNQQRGAGARYGAATAHALAAAIANTRLLASFRGVSSFLMYVALLATLWLGARLIGQGSLTVGELTSFVIYAGMVTSSSGAVSDFWSDWMRTIGATERVFEIIGSEPQPQASQQPADAVVLRGELAFRDVGFVYPERPEKLALDHVSFSIAAGENVALVGASGAGKSTIASMILGFYQPDSGGIAFDGVPAEQLDLAGVRAHIAIVEQEPSLFSGSIFENIAFALPDREVTRAEVVDAARLANAHDFIEGFPHGYDTVVGERGVQLSGGQKQRIAIARAVLRDPKILILDEATSALDAASEQQVQQALDTLMAGRTTIVIAHRYSTIVKADRVLVLEHGAVVQSGPHAQLIEQRDGVYFHLMKSQLQFSA